jgi:hypothetical protein
VGTRAGRANRRAQLGGDLVHQRVMHAAARDVDDVVGARREDPDLGRARAAAHHQARAVAMAERGAFDHGGRRQARVARDRVERVARGRRDPGLSVARAAGTRRAVRTGLGARHGQRVARSRGSIHPRRGRSGSSATPTAGVGVGEQSVIRTRGLVTFGLMALVRDRRAPGAPRSPRGRS